MNLEIPIELIEEKLQNAKTQIAVFVNLISGLSADVERIESVLAMFRQFESAPATNSAITVRQSRNGRGDLEAGNGTRQRGQQKDVILALENVPLDREELAAVLNQEYRQIGAIVTKLLRSK